MPTTIAGQQNPQPPRVRRRITLWVLRLGIGGFFVAAALIALVSFSLFGCPCFEGMTVRKEPDPVPATPTPVGPETVQPKQDPLVK
jgi:hypothetical protein